MRTRIGDIVEIRTSIGLGYAIYTHRHTVRPRFGHLLRIFDRIFDARIERVDLLAEVPIRFSIFFPLQTAINRGLVQIVGNIPVPDELKAFPLFRTGSSNPISREVGTWWLWDGEREWPVGALTKEQRKLPIRGVWNDTMLVHRIESGWRPENDSF